MNPYKKIEMFASTVALRELYVMFLNEYNADRSITSFSIDEIKRIIESKIDDIWKSEK